MSSRIKESQGHGALAEIMGLTIDPSVLCRTGLDTGLRRVRSRMKEGYSDWLMQMSRPEVTPMLQQAGHRTRFESI